MSIIDHLSSSIGRKDKKQNKKLASEITRKEDDFAIKELVESLHRRDKNIQSDCIDTLYEIGYLKPGLIAHYHQAFMELLIHANNRMVWGGMIALSTIVDHRHKEIFSDLDRIMKAIDHGSVITIDNGVNILIKLTRYQEYEEVTSPLLMDQLWKCAIKQLPMYAERSLECIGDRNNIEFRELLQKRYPECKKESQKKRLQRIIKKIT